MICDTTDNNGTDSPEHLQHLSCRSSESHGYDFSAVSGCVGDEDSPWDTLQNLSREEHALGVTEVEDEDECVEGHETSDGCPAVSNPGCDGSGDEDTDEGTYGSRTLERGLPGGDDDVFSWLGGAGDTEIFGELGGCDELTHQEDAVGFHDLKRLLSETCLYLGFSFLAGEVYRMNGYDGEKNLQWCTT